MAITVHRLIKQLQEIENKFLEVEVCDVDKEFSRREIDRIQKSTDKCVLIFVKDKK
jgi:hypothetical protein